MGSARSSQPLHSAIVNATEPRAELVTSLARMPVGPKSTETTMSRPR
jgi:hypothetical protein